MVKINKHEKDLLIKNGLIKQNHMGEHVGIRVCSKNKNSNGHTYYVEEELAEWVKNNK